ncbi:MAG: hypothetical protein K0U76_08715 [Actinomycetia bacterium]|nr:hypothetical protein [Actinomycetes bacterium]MCH9701457.1 hypothetical protein [Actinomycetes bacterium]
MSHDNNALLTSRMTVASSIRAIGPTALVMVAALASGVSLGGCGPAGNEPEAHTLAKESLTTTTAAQPSAAEAFPDLASYNVAPFDVYEVVDTPRVQGFAFTTPDGLQCANNAYPTPEFEWVSCWGPRPDMGPGLWSVNAEQGAPATIERVALEDVDTPGSTPPLLPPLTRISAQKGSSTCGVGEDGSTACRVGDHGFVLTPDSTTLF